MYSALRLHSHPSIFRSWQNRSHPVRDLKRHDNGKTEVQVQLSLMTPKTSVNLPQLAPGNRGKPNRVKLVTQIGAGATIRHETIAAKSHHILRSIENNWHLNRRLINAVRFCHNLKMPRCEIGALLPGAVKPHMAVKWTVTFRFIKNHVVCRSTSTLYLQAGSPITT